jgi:hypothetical protein
MLVIKNKDKEKELDDIVLELYKLENKVLNGELNNLHDFTDTVHSLAVKLNKWKVEAEANE